MKWTQMAVAEVGIKSNEWDHNNVNLNSEFLHVDSKSEKERHMSQCCSWKCWLTRSYLRMAVVMQCYDPEILDAQPLV